MLKLRPGMSVQALGFSLIELLVGMTLVAIFMSLAAPSFSTWIQNSRIRSTAEAISAGLQTAKSEAVARNTLVRFQLTSSTGDDCVISNSGTSWVVDMVDADASEDSVEGKCNAAPSDTAAPRIVQVRPGAEVSGGSVVAASTASLVFNSLGKLSPVPTADTTIDISNPSGACAADGGDLTCLRIVVTPGGQVRMCNPRFPSGDPQAC